MAELPADVRDAVVVSHRWVELGRESLLALQVTYMVESHGELEGLIWFTEKAQSMGRRGLRSLGFDITDKDPSELDDKPTLLAGAKCKVKLVPYSNNGVNETKADLVIPRDVPVGRGSLKALGERIKSGAKAPAPKAETYTGDGWDAATPAVSTGPKREPINKPHDVNFDDIPFLFLLVLLIPFIN